MKEEYSGASREKLQEYLRLFQKASEYDHLYNAYATLLQVSHRKLIIGGENDIGQRTIKNDIVYIATQEMQRRNAVETIDITDVSEEQCHSEEDACKNFEESIYSDSNE